MLYLIGPDGLVNRRFVNFQNMVWMTMVHVLNLGMHVTHIHAVFWKFAYPRFTPYADNIRFSHEQNLNQVYAVALEILISKIIFETGSFKKWSF